MNFLTKKETFKIKRSSLDISSKNLSPNGGSLEHIEERK